MTIQDYFYSLENAVEDFPTGVNYISNYKSFKTFMDEHIHPEVRIMTSRLDEKVFLNNHGVPHINMIIEKITHIIEDVGFEFITPYEYFFLLMAIQIHDAGHVISGRDGHEEAGSSFLSYFNRYTMSTFERKVISDIAKSHSGKNDPIGNLQSNMLISGKNIRPRLLASLLRIGDELADEKSRASQYLLEENAIPEYSKLFHAFSASLDTYIANPKSGTINMLFCMNKKYVIEKFKKVRKGIEEEVYLLDEIYTRSIKAFTECLYYNRFVPESIRFRVIDVRINFLDDNGMVYYEPIAYRIEEKGYPQDVITDIFSLVGNQLMRNGKLLTGQYINTLMSAN